jgi:hypothetical protein
MRRNSDEVDYKPSVGLLRANGTIERHYLNTSEDIIDATEEVRKAEEVGADLTEFIDELEASEGNDFDYRFEVQRYIDLRVKEQTISDGAAGLLLKSIGH